MVIYLNKLGLSLLARSLATHLILSCPYYLNLAPWKKTHLQRSQNTAFSCSDCTLDATLRCKDHAQNFISHLSPATLTEHRGLEPGLQAKTKMCKYYAHAFSCKHVSFTFARYCNPASRKPAQLLTPTPTPLTPPAPNAASLFLSALRPAVLSL